MLFTKSFIPALYSCLFQLYFPVAAQDDSFSNQSGLRAPSLVRNIVFYRYLAPVCRQAGLRGNPFKLLAHTNTPISLFISFSFSPILSFPSSCSSQNHLSLLFIHASSNYIFPLRRRTILFPINRGYVRLHWYVTLFSTDILPLSADRQAYGAILSNFSRTPTLPSHFFSNSHFLPFSSSLVLPFSSSHLPPFSLSHLHALHKIIYPCSIFMPLPIILSRCGAGRFLFPINRGYVHLHWYVTLFSIDILPLSADRQAYGAILSYFSRTPTLPSPFLSLSHFSPFSLSHLLPFSLSHLLIFSPSLFPIFMLFTKSFNPALYSCLFQLYFPVAAQDDSFFQSIGVTCAFIGT